MDLSDLSEPQAAPDAQALLQAFEEQALDAARRPLRMRLGGREGPLDRVLLLQSIDIVERLNHGIEGHLTCLSTRCDLPLEAFEGVPVEVGIVTDQGRLRPIRAIVCKAVRGQSDGALTLYQLGLADPLALLGKRIATRLFNDRSVVEVSDALLQAALAECPAFGGVFTWRWLVDEARHPRREFWMQKSESVGAYLQRQWARCGISWFLRPLAAADAGADEQRIELVLFDDPMRLEAAPSEELSFHRLDATEPADAVVLWSSMRQLASGAVARSSWDYKTARTDRAVRTGSLDHGASGGPIAAWLADSRIELPHAGDDLRDFERLTGLRMARHDFEAGCSRGIGGVRSLAVGQSRCMAGVPELEGKPPEERSFTFIEVHHRGENNLKLVSEHAARLLDASARLADWAPAAAFADARDADSAQGPAQRQRYLNRFVAVRRGTPLVARWEPQEDLPRTPSMTAIVAGPEGESVHTDALGRVRVRFAGEESGATSAWMRCNAVHAGAGEGLLLPLKCGMEVTVEWEAGDESRPVIARVHYNGANPPPRFDHAGGLPGNRYMAGLHLHEIGSQRYGELVFDMTSGQISVQLGSEHAYSRLALGELRGRRRDGQAAPIGEGFHLRTDASGAVRTARSLLLTAWKRLEGAGTQLDAEEHLALMQDALALFKSLAGYAAEHQGLAGDDKAQADLHADVAAAQGGSNTDPHGRPGAPTISISAPAGIASSTPKTILSCAGINIDSIAQRHIQQTAGGRWRVDAGQGMGLFAQQGGISAIAHHGTLLLQSQHGNTQIDSGGDMTLAAQGSLKLMAKDILIASEGGAWVSLADALTLASKAAILSKGSAFPHEGPAGKAVDLPKFADGPSDQKFVLRYGGPGAPPAGSRRYEVTMDDGSVKTGTSDAEGRTELLRSETLRMAAIRILSEER